MIQYVMAGLSLLESIDKTSSAREQGRLQSDYLRRASLEMNKAQDAFNQTLNPSLQSAVLEGRRASDIVSEKGQKDFMQLKKQL